MAESIVTAVPRPSAGRPGPEASEFPGCRPVCISRDEIADYEGRIEFWDADTEIAMVCEPVGYYHERPSARLAGLAKTIGSARVVEPRVSGLDGGGDSSGLARRPPPGRSRKGGA